MKIGVVARGGQNYHSVGLLLGKYTRVFCFSSGVAIGLLDEV